MVKLKTIADEYGLTVKEVYTSLLWYSNRNSIRILETDNAIFDEAYKSIENSVEMLNEYIYDAEKHIKTSIPIDTQPYIYFLFKGFDLIYIGQSCNIAGRVSIHRNDKDFDGVAYKKVTSRDKDTIEMVNINYWQPTLNKAGIGDSCYFNIVLESSDFGVF